MNLEDKIKDKEEKTQPSIWDSLAAAYSTSKAVKIGLIAIDYSYAMAAAASIGFYIVARSAYAVLKSIFKILTFQYNSARELYNEIKDIYNPFGKMKRSTILGGTLGSVTQLTGF